MEGAERQEPVSNPVITQAPSQVGGLTHPPPFTRVAVLPQSNNAQHDNAYYNSLCTVILRWVGKILRIFRRRRVLSVHGSTGGSVDLLRRAILTNYRTPVYLRDHEPDCHIPYTRSVASDCGGREVTLARVRLLICLTCMRTHTHWLVTRTPVDSLPFRCFCA